MVRNPEGPTLQRMEQTSQSAARKQVAVRACPDQNSEQTCNRRKSSQEITTSRMQKSKAREGRVMRWWEA